MALFSLLDVNLCFGGPAVLDKVNFQVDPGERLCLVGRNGAGKSTLMKTIAGEIKPDTGAVFRQPGALFTRLTQEVPTDIVGSVTDIVTSGLRPQGEHEEDWERDVRVDNLASRKVFIRCDKNIKMRIGRRATVSNPAIHAHEISGMH